MTKRIFRTILATSFVVLLVGIAVIIGILYPYFGGQLEKELENEASYLSLSVEKDGVAALEQLPHSSSTRITLIASNGVVLYDSQADAAQMENHADREEVRDAMENGSGKAWRQSDTLDEQNIYYALRLSNRNVLRISSAQRSVVSLVLGVLQPLLWVALLLIILAAVFASRASKKIVAPLNSLDLENPEKNDIYDEVAPLLTKIDRQQKTIRQQLAEAKHRQEEFSLITSHMSEGLLVLDSRMDLLSYNESALRLLGVSEEKSSYVGKNILVLNRNEAFREVVESSLAGHHSETLLSLNDLSCQIIANPVLTDGKVAGAVLLLVDVTEKTQREAIRREFTANVSHELKTPLTSISGFAELLQNGIAKPEDTKKFAGRIFDEAQRLITLVSDIIKISQIDEGHLPYTAENVDLRALISGVLDRLRSAAERADISLSLREGNASLETVAPILEEILYNLVDNAIKYNKKGGKVAVSVEKDGRQTRIRVQDTGIGVPPAQQQRIFERFYRVDKSHSKEIGGTGLGLSIVKHGAAYLGAQILVESTPGEGSTFTLVWDSTC